MKRAIWKFVVPVSGGDVEVGVSRVSSIKHAAIDPRTKHPALWISVNPEAIDSKRKFRIYATGQEIEGDEGYPYDLHVGSVVDEHGFVWHIYEVRT